MSAKLKVSCFLIAAVAFVGLLTQVFAICIRGSPGTLPATFAFHRAHHPRLPDVSILKSAVPYIFCHLVASGFLMICLGGFFISNSIFHSQRNLVMSYVLLPMGFMILLSGIFWATYCQASENKEMFNHALRQHLASQDLPLATVDRPDFYPPTYEESLDAEKQACAAGRGLLGFPPPPYTATSLELEDENDPQPEAPPPYQESTADAVVTAEAQDANAQGPSPVLKAGPALLYSKLTSC